jgi:hypothetical protein
MRTDFSVFRERFVEACRLRNMSDVAVCRSIGLGSRSTINLSLSGPKALDLYRV